MKNNNLTFGQNVFQHLYNRIHFLNSFEDRCVNITFNKLVEPIKSNSFNRNEFPIKLQRSYLKLPEQNDLLIDFILQKNNYTIYDLRKRPIIRCFSFIERKFNKIIRKKIRKCLNKSTSRYLLANNDLLTLNQNVECQFELDEQCEYFSENDIES